MKLLLAIRPRATFMLAMCVTLAAAAWAEQTWKTKPPEKWSQKDAKKILNDSPWSKIVMMPYHSYTAQGAEPDTRVGVGGNRLPPTVGDPMDPRRPASDWALIVRWSSSRTIRRAEGIAPSDGTFRHGDRDPDKRLSAYRVTVIPASLTHPLPYWRERDLAMSSWLKFGPDGEEIPPEEVRVDHAMGYDRADAYIFIFPMKDANGEPLLRDDVKEIHFFCRLGPVATRAKFERAKMHAHDGPDI